MSWISYAEWPEESFKNSYGLPVSTDNHDTEDLAMAVTRLLRTKGFGGDGRYYPVDTAALPVVEVAWFGNLFKMLSVGGTWGSTVSGTIFVKAKNGMVCKMRMPWDDKLKEGFKEQGIEMDEKGWLKRQADDLREIRRRFMAAGIAVTDESK